jgi:hypothetical protein
MSPLLIYLVFGSPTYHAEARFSIVSAIARARQTPSLQLRIRVYTDDPLPYAGLPVELADFSSARRDALTAPIHYVFRAKHAILLEALEEVSAAVLIDTDTFFRHSPLRLFERVMPGQLLCNALGPHYGEIREQPLYRLLASTLQSKHLADDGMRLTNSGVIGLTQADRGVLQQAMRLMDEYYVQSGQAYTMEEFTLAVSARKAGLSLAGCTDVIHHYWSRKKLFRAKVQAWNAKHGRQPLSERALADTERVTDALPRPPTATRLGYRLATRALPGSCRQFVREILYGCYPYPNEFDAACAPVWWEKAFDNALGRGADHAKVLQWLESHLVGTLIGARRVEVRQYLKRYSEMID